MRHARKFQHKIEIFLSHRITLIYMLSILGLPLECLSFALLCCYMKKFKITQKINEGVIEGKLK